MIVYSIWNCDASQLSRHSLFLTDFLSEDLIGCPSFMRRVRPLAVVEVFPFFRVFIQISVPCVIEQLMELNIVCQV
jgi:hypothetical protein